MFAKIFFAAVFATLPAAFPIGRIGNNSPVLDRVDGYQAEPPHFFASLTQVQDGGWILGSGRFVSLPVGDEEGAELSSVTVPLELQVLPFRSQYPMLSGAGVVAMETFFRESPGISYQKIAADKDSLQLIGETASSHIGVLVCGDGRGYVVLGPKLPQIRQGIVELFHNTVFEVPCHK